MSSLRSSLLTWFLSSWLSGESRQVSMFQICFNVVGALILVPAFYVEVFTDIPLMLALAAQFSANPSMQLGIINLLFNVVPALIAFPLVGFWANVLARRYPQTAEEQLSRPRYLLEQTGDDPHNAIRLIELEQARLIEILTRTFEAMRSNEGPKQVESLNEAFEGLGTAIHEAVQDLSSQHQLSSVLYERLNGLLNIQHSLETANAEVQSLASKIETLRGSGRGERFARVAVDGIDAILLTLLDVARDREEMDLGLLQQMTSEDGMTRVRKAYLAEEDPQDSTSRMELLAAANHCERLIWLFGDMGLAYETLGTQ